MRLLDHLLSGFFRKLGYALAALVIGGIVAMCTVPKAHAQTSTVCSSSSSVATDNCDDQGTARRAADAAIAQYHVNNPNSALKLCIRENLTGSNYSYQTGRASNCGSGFTTQFTRYWPAAKMCSARPDSWAGFTRSDEKYCDAGCEVQLEGTPLESFKIDSPRSNSILAGRGKFSATGNACSVSDGTANKLPPREPPKDDFCGVLEGGYKVCLNSKGQQCITSPKTGRTYCGPQTGPMNATDPNRTENVVTSPQAPAPGVPPTSPTPRQGEDWRPGQTATVTNQTTNNVTNTTVNNQAGTPNNTPGSGTPGDGSDNQGSDGEGEGDDDDDEGTVSGGGECSAPPQCSGPEEYQCHIVNQLWLERCQGLDGLNPDIDAAVGKVNDLEAEWSNWTGGYSGDAWSKYVEGQSATADSIVGAEDLPFGDLDTSGFLGGDACPQLPSLTLQGTTIGLDLSELCSMLSSLGLLVEALAYFLAIRILTGAGR